MTSTHTKWLAGAAMTLVMVAGAPLAAQAQGAYQDSYDGYCYAKKEDAKTTGTVVGAIAGGLLGSQVSKNERGLGAVGGAVIGGAIGRSVGANSVKCLNGEYYSYQSSRYTPADAPDGYDVVYYKSRPSSDTYTTVYYDRNRRTSQGYAYNGNGQPYNGGAYNGSGQSYNGGGHNGNNGYGNGSSYTPSNAVQGWRDSTGTWHASMPAAFGWKDRDGRWHEGQLVAYGYKDKGGSWHETQQVAPSYGHNNNYTPYSNYNNGYGDSGY